MSTNYIAPIWRMPRNANKDKLSNYSIDFDGSSDVINIPNSTDFNLGTAFTISGWFNFDIVSNLRGLISFDSSTTRGWFLYTYLNEIRLFNVTTVYTLKTGYSYTGQWDHFVVTYDGTDLVFYLNGVQESTQAVTLNLQTNGCDGQIGNNQKAAGRFFNGKISQISIFDYALTDGTTPGTTNQIEYLYNLNNPMVPGAVNLTAPIAYWPLGDNSNPNAPGSYPNISVEADSVFDFIPNDYIDLGTSLQDILSSNQNTISFWFRSDTASDFDTLFSQGKDSSIGYRLFLSGGDLSRNRSEQNPTNDRQTITISPGPSSQTWNHLVLVTDTSATTKLIAYLNGDPVGSYATGTITYSNGGSVAWIGGTINIS